MRKEHRDQLEAGRANVERLKREWMQREILRRAAMTDKQRDRSYQSRANTAAARARKYGSPGAHTGEDLKRLMENQRGICAACHQDMRDVYHVDHVIEMSDGGSNDPSNLQLLCIPCNLKKGGKHRSAGALFINYRPSE